MLRAARSWAVTLVLLLVLTSCAPTPDGNDTRTAARLVKIPVEVVKRKVRVKLKPVRVPVPSRAVPPPTGRLVSYAPGCRLRAGAAASLEFIEAIIGRQLQTVSCWRSAAQQAALYATKGPGIAAAPGSSLHEDGLAIDMDMGFLQRNPRVGGLLREFGWAQFAPSWEPWHFSYRTVG